MIYLLKFGASFILPPGIFLVALVLLAGYSWRQRQRRIAMEAGAVVVPALVPELGLPGDS